MPSQIPDPSPGTQAQCALDQERTSSASGKSHQSRPLLKICVQLIRHVVQQHVHLGVLGTSVSQGFNVPPFFDPCPQSIRLLRLTASREVQRGASCTPFRTNMAFAAGAAQNAHVGKCAAACDKMATCTFVIIPPACTHARTCDPHVRPKNDLKYRWPKLHQHFFFCTSSLTDLQRSLVFSNRVLNSFAGLPSQTIFATDCRVLESCAVLRGGHREVLRDWFGV